jgi:hypothetical protein
MKRDEQILAELARAVKGLWYMSESDYPFETVRLEGTTEPNPEALPRLAGADPNTLVETRELEDFFREGAAVRMSQEGAGEPASFAAVVQTLTENLKDIRVYRIGEINIPVYVLGRSASGSWLGVSTRVVET